jgi:DsbC/DsbD-like thiol-disulfide interchange protein
MITLFRTSCVSMAVTAALLSLGACAFADAPGHLTATGKVSPASVKAGGKGVLVVHLTIASGYHINSSKPTQDYLVGTKITVTGAPGVTFGSAQYPAPTIITEGADKVSAYVGSASVKIPFTVKAGAKSGPVSGSVFYQACNAQSCFPPTTEKFSATLTVK